MNESAYVPYLTWDTLKKLIPSFKKGEFIEEGKKGFAPRCYSESKFNNSPTSTHRQVWIKSEIDDYLKCPESYGKAAREAAALAEKNKPDYSYIDLDEKPCKQRLWGC